MRELKKLLPLGVLLLTACQATPHTSGTDSLVIDTSCFAFEPIRASRTQDSEETRDQVEAHNAAWDTLCKPLK